VSGRARAQELTTCGLRAESACFAGELPDSAELGLACEGRRRWPAAPCPTHVEVEGVLTLRSPGMHPLGYHAQLLRSTVMLRCATRARSSAWQLHLHTFHSACPVVLDPFIRSRLLCAAPCR